MPDPKLISELDAIPTAPTDGDLVPVDRSGITYKADVADLPGSGGGLANVVEDTTPQLGGNLDLNGHTITGLVPGMNIQAYDADLAAVAALSPTNDDFIQRKAGAWTNRTIAQVAADLGNVAVTAANHSKIYINDFYPAGEGPRNTLAELYVSRTPADLSYATIDDYIADLPAFCQASATLWKDWAPAPITIDDEIDYIALQVAFNYGYDTGTFVNMVDAGFVLEGFYKTNRQTVCTLNGVHIEGIAPNAGGYGPGIHFMGGAVGTVDAPTSVLRIFTYDELGAVATDRTFGQGGCTVVLKNFLILGTQSATSTSNQATGHGYCNGISVASTQFFEADHVTCAGNLYDGMVFTRSQLWVNIHDCRISSSRDGISNYHDEGDNTTTFWIHHNEFGGSGRYAILLDHFSGGAVEQMPLIYDNSFECDTDSFYYQHPEWYVQGVRAWMCIINGSLTKFERNRFEGSGGTPNAWACLHLCSSSLGLTLRGNTMGGWIVFSTFPSGDPRTSAASTKGNADGWSDVTDQRNYNVGRLGHITSNGQGQCVISENYNFLGLLTVNGYGLFDGTSLVTVKEISEIAFIDLSTKPGTYTRLVENMDECVPLYSTSFGRLVMQNVNNYRGYDGIRYIGSKDTVAGTGSFALTANGRTAWVTATHYSPFFSGYDPSRHVRPTTPNGRFYQCMVDGTSHAATEPTWSNLPAPVLFTYQGGTPISAITKANPAVVSMTSHGLSNGDKFVVTGGDMVEIRNKILTAANVTANTVEAQGEDSFAYTAYDEACGFLFKVIVDGTTAWRCAGYDFQTGEAGQERLEGGKRVRYGTAAPTVGDWAVGDRIINSAPAAGGVEGWVCTTAGKDGSAVFKTYGSIAA